MMTYTCMEQALFLQHLGHDGHPLHLTQAIYYDINYRRRHGVRSIHHGGTR